MTNSSRGRDASKISRLLAALQVQPDDLGGSDSFIDQIANDLVAVGRDAHSLALPDEFADHSRGGESLAGARRPLKGKDSPRPNGRQVGPRPEASFLLPCEWARRQSRGPRFSKRSQAGLLRTAARQTVGDNMLAETHERVRQHLSTNNLWAYTARGCIAALSPRFLTSTVRLWNEMDLTAPNSSPPRSAALLLLEFRFPAAGICICGSGSPGQSHRHFR